LRKSSSSAVATLIPHPETRQPKTETRNPKPNYHKVLSLCISNVLQMISFLSVCLKYSESSHLNDRCKRSPFLLNLCAELGDEFAQIFELGRRRRQAQLRLVMSPTHVKCCEPHAHYLFIITLRKKYGHGYEPPNGDKFHHGHQPPSRSS